ncbi:hypothetical protein [Dyadobacter psychrotolerans]|uniref:Tissue inhibitor of metalloproteinase n=1 Tax=Dyadobacter psychrotolerans TaxID=2541721 RepID=A0A4R5E0P1_9BACT|nr:hypothetical protein [Dyadobacter psychrotolerans]TDE17355.1 hypothetical protein E0F88_05550 [Dyadobacter psychrotolerans]
MKIDKSGKILLLILMLVANEALACMCMHYKFAEKYIQSDFVAVAKITKVYPNEGEEEIYKADIKIRNLLKGENLQSIYIQGRSDGKRGSSCSIFIPENTELIIYARKTAKNKFSFGSCSGYLILNQKGIGREKTEKREMEMLKLLKAENINFTNTIRIGNKMGFSDKLKKFDGINLNKSYSIYEITLASDLSVKKLDLISGFGGKVDNELSKIIQKSTWTSFEYKSERSVVKDKVPDGCKFLLAFYFYNAEKVSKSFIGEYDL